MRLFLTFFFLWFGCVRPNFAYGMSFDDWYEEFRRDAVEEGVRVSTLDAAFYDVKMLDSVISSDRKQPEFRKDLKTYLDNAINVRRVQQAKKALAQHREFLQKLYEKYGVTSNYLIAFWAMETDFGRTKGAYPVFSALATLSYDTRRSEFFRKELISALRLVEKGLSVDVMKGSWAGAMGNFQFMPTTYLAFGVDGDGDGKIDIFNSYADAMASAANYLAAEGWKRGQRWGREVRLPKNFNWSLIEREKTLKEWSDLGISFVTKPVGTTEPPTLKAKLILPEGIEGPAFLAYPNFYVIMRWNKSVLYALAIGHLADRMLDRPPFETLQDKTSEPFSLEDAAEVQRILASMNLYRGDIDGILGAKTRESVRAFQEKYDLPPDGYANAGLLTFMRLVSNKKNTADKLSFDEVVELQKILSKGRYYIGPLDGKLGESTKEGVNLFKRVYNIRSAEIDKRLLVKMRLHAGRNMENGEIEPVVREYHEKRERERRAAEARRKAELARRKAEEKRRRKELEEKQKAAAKKAAETVAQTPESDNVSALGKILRDTLEKPFENVLQNPNAESVKKTLKDGEKK